MGALRSLFGWFFGSRPEPFDPASLRLPQYDVRALLEELEVEKRGEENGRHELPPTHATAFDGPQSEIVQAITSSVLLAQSKLTSHLSGLTNRIQHTDVTSLCNDAGQLPSRHSSDLDTLWSKQADRLGPPRQQYAAIRSQYDHFRDQHRIRWEPHYPDSHIKHVAVLLGLLVSETWLNSVYFAKGSDFGLIGGLTQAGGVAVVNVLFSFFAGRWASWIRCTRNGFRVVGWLATVAFIIWLAGYNLIVAHLRDQFAANPDGTIESGLAAFAAAPLVLQDQSSWFLVLLGAFFCAVAFADGTRWDDHNPGYSKLHKRLISAREEYLHEKQAMLREALDLRDRSLARLCDISERVKYLKASLAEAVHQKATLVVQAKTFFEASEGACNALLSRYRDINQRFRKTPPPAYFQESWTYDVPEELRPDLRPDQDWLELQSKMARRLEEARDSLRKAIESATSDFQLRMKSISDPDGEEPSTARLGNSEGSPRV